MKNFFLIVIGLILGICSATAQGTIFNGEDATIQIVSITGYHKTGFATIRMKFRSNIQQNKISFYSCDVWDNDGNTYTFEADNSNYTDGIDGTVYNVSKDISVNLNIGNLFLYIPDTMKSIRTLRISYMRRDVGYGLQYAVFHNIPVNWTTGNPLPATFTKSVEEYFGSKGTTPIVPISEDRKNFYWENGDFQGHVVAAIGSIAEHKVKVICRVKTTNVGKNYLGTETYLYHMGYIYAKEGLHIWDKNPKTRDAVVPGEWNDVVLDFEMPTSIKILSDIGIGLSTQATSYNGFYDQYRCYAFDIPIQWVDVPEAKRVTADDLLKMVGKNRVGKIQLGTKIDEVPQSIDGMYDRIEVEDSYSPSNTKGKRIGFFSGGEEIMYGWSFDKNNRDTGRIQWLVIQKNGNSIKEINWQK